MVCTGTLLSSKNGAAGVSSAKSLAGLRRLWAGTCCSATGAVSGSGIGSPTTSPRCICRASGSATKRSLLAPNNWRLNHSICCCSVWMVRACWCSIATSCCGSSAATSVASGKRLSSVVDIEAHAIEGQAAATEESTELHGSP